MGARFSDGLRLDWKRRFAVGMLMLGVSLCYLPLNYILDGGTTVEIWLDQYVPFWSVWIVPYLLAIVWWFVAGIWAFLAMEDSLYLAFAASWLIAGLIGFSIFVLQPTYMVRPSLTGSGWAEAVVAYVYANDKTYNAFPSMHLWTTVTITLYWNRWKPKWRIWMWAATIVVALSTVFSGQHWILDVVGGTLLAFLCYHFGPALMAWVLPGRRRHVSVEAGK